MTLIAFFPPFNEPTTIRRLTQNDITNVNGTSGETTNYESRTNYSETQKKNESCNDTTLKVNNLTKKLLQIHNANIRREKHNETSTSCRNSNELLNIQKSGPERREINDALEYGMDSLHSLIKVKEPLWYKQGLFLDENHPASRVAKFGAPISEKAKLLSNIGFAILEASQRVAESYPGNVGTKSPGLPDDLQPRIDLDECPLRGRPKCPLASKRFRTADGICNNLDHPWRGAAILPMQRFLPPVYEDGIQSIRRSVLGPELPLARDISATIHRDKNVEIDSVTLMFMQWGQFLDHDIISVVKSRSFNGSIPRCCDIDGRGFLPADLTHPSCLPIEIPPDDWFLSQFGIRCMEFVRSAPSTRIDCDLGWREQINQVTSYIDASMIYGSDVETSDSIRTFRNGKIIYGRGPLNHPDPVNSELCRAGAITEECMEAGDGRLSEQPGLIAMHTVFVRYHNKIATVLSKVNKHWSDERTFQETRKIVYSVIQHITFREFLPVVLGPEVMDLFELRLKTKGFYTLYDSKFDPAISNSFATAAFRFGHSMVQNSLIRTDSEHIPLNNNVSLHEEFNNFENIWSVGATDRLLLGLSNQPSQKRDEFIANELTNHLFQFSDSLNFGMDLGAINIQRGRDHGIPPYTSWRAPCGLTPIQDWKDLERVMSVNVVIRLRSLYRHIDDVDLFTAGLAERPLRGAVVGPTFACIIAQQFLNLRRGDRFWYENGGFESSFTPAQLQQIRKVTLSQVLCQTTNEIETIQPFVFLSADNVNNVRLSCDSSELRNFNLGVWTEKLPKFEKNTNRLRRSGNYDKESISAENKYAEFNTVPKRPTFQSNGHQSDISYLFGVAPEQTTAVNKPIQININIQYFPQTTTKTTVTRKKRPNTSYLTNAVTTYRPIVSNYPISQIYDYNRPTSRPVTSSIITINQQRPGNYYNQKPLNDYYDVNPFSSSNRPLYYSTKRPISDHYFNDDAVVTYDTNNHKPNFQNSYNRDRIDVDDIHEHFFLQIKDDVHLPKRPNFTRPSNVQTHIDDKLDFRSRIINKDSKDSADDKFVKIAAVHGEAVVEGRRYDKSSVDSSRKIRIVDMEVIPSEDRSEWNVFNTEETPGFMEMPRLVANSNYSKELPRPMTIRRGG